MSTRGSQFTRTMRYFRESDLDEAASAMARAIAIVSERTKATSTAVPKVRKARKPRSASGAQAATTDAAS
jgi:hypothetical protein